MNTLRLLALSAVACALSFTLIGCVHHHHHDGRYEYHERRGYWESRHGGPDCDDGPRYDRHDRYGGYDGRWR